jgi:hypothetical protein
MDPWLEIGFDPAGFARVRKELNNYREAEISTLACYACCCWLALSEP